MAKKKFTCNLWNFTCKLKKKHEVPVPHHAHVPLMFNVGQKGLHIALSHIVLRLVEQVQSAFVLGEDNFLPLCFGKSPSKNKSAFSSLFFCFCFAFVFICRSMRTLVSAGKFAC